MSCNAVENGTSEAVCNRVHEKQETGTKGDTCGNPGWRPQAYRCTMYFESNVENVQSGKQGRDRVV